MVDMRPVYTTMSASLLRELGLCPWARASFLVADGRSIEMDSGEDWATVEQRSVTTLVVSVEQTVESWRRH